MLVCTMDKYLQRRFDKAKALAATPRAIETYGVGYRVRSTRGGWYYVRVTLTQGKLTYAQCNCPDFGQCTHRGVPVCKHVLAVGLQLTKRVLPKYQHTIKETFSANAEPDHKAVVDNRPMFYPAPPW